jgi:hypothetical protein
MTDTPGWAPPSSSEPPHQEGRPSADAPAPVPGQSSPHQTTPPAWSGSYGSPRPPQQPPQQWGVPQQPGPPQWGGGQQQWGPQPWGGAPLSPKPGIIPLRPLGVGEILDGAVSTVRRHWRTALGVSLGLSAIEQTISTALLWWSYDQPDSILPTVATVAKVPVTLLITVVATAMLTMLVSRAVLGRPVTLGEVWRDARPRLLPQLGLTLLIGVICLGILALFAAPLIGYAIAGELSEGAKAPLVLLALLGALLAYWVSIQLSLAAPALMLEKQGIRTALSRSLRLVRGSRWRIVGINLLSRLLLALTAGIISIPFSIAAVILSGDELLDSADSGFTAGLDVALPPAALIAVAIGGLIAGTITIPAGAAINVLVYVDQRIRREALDIELARAAGLPEYGGTSWNGAGDPAAPRL